MIWSFQFYLFIKVPIPRDLVYVVKCFRGKSSSVKSAYQQLTFEKGHFPRHESL